MGGPLILSIFPGIDMLGRAFEEVWPEACVVRGPDLLWGGDIKTFHPPAGQFDGVIGGPPCKGDSALAHLNGTAGHHIRDEFRRVVDEARPSWYVLESVVPPPEWDDYTVALSPRWLGEPQSRLRYFTSNLKLDPETEALEPIEYAYAVRASNRASGKGTVRRGMASYSWADMKRLQGLPDDFDLPMLTMRGKEETVGNGVPMAMGRAIARAVRRAVESPTGPAR